jgi:hypothetical protein
MCNPTVLRYSNEQLIQTVIISLILDQIQRSNYCALRCAALRMLRWNVSGVLVALTIQQSFKNLVTCLSRDMASVSRNLGRSRMMVFANTGAHTYSMKRKFSYIGILMCTHIPCVIMDISVYFGWCRVENTEMESNGSNGLCRIYSMAYTLINVGALFTLGRCV